MSAEHSGSKKSSSIKFQVPDSWSGNRKRPVAVSVETMMWHGKLVTAGQMQTLSENIRNWQASSGPSGTEVLGRAGIGTSAYPACT